MNVLHFHFKVFPLIAATLVYRYTSVDFNSSEYF